jgi:DNA-binding NtrC family response regulator
MEDSGWNLLTAESATAARRIVVEHRPHAAVVDYMLPDGYGIELAVEFQQTVPGMTIVTMTGTILPPGEWTLVEQYNFHHLFKPFLPSEVMDLIRAAAQD